jgi:hypothetical protein
MLKKLRYPTKNFTHALQKTFPIKALPPVTLAAKYNNKSNRNFGFGRWFKGKLLDYADYIEHGSKEDQESLPEIIIEESPFSELERANMTIPSSAKLNELDIQNKENIISSVEQDRLDYIDSVLGTRTHLHRPNEFEVRTSYDAIMERRWLKSKHGALNEFRYADT